MLKHNDEARRHFLSFKRNPPALCVGIYEPCVEQVSELLRVHRRVPHLRTEWGFESFESNLERGYGFDGAFVHQGVEDRYLLLSALFTPATKALAVSLGILLDLLCYFEHLTDSLSNKDAPVDSRRFQLMLIQSGLVKDGGFYGAPMGGYVSPIFTNWVERVSAHRERLEDVEEAMMLAWNAMSTFPEQGIAQSTLHRDFCCAVRDNGTFYLRTLGNACDISTLDGERREPGEGHEIGCHNLDTAIQQLSLFAGLATMHDLARKSIDKRSPA